MKSCGETTYVPHRPQLEIHKFGVYVVFPSYGRFGAISHVMYMYVFQSFSY